jgi:hypothetical protein
MTLLIIVKIGLTVEDAAICKIVLTAMKHGTLPTAHARGRAAEGVVNPWHVMPLGVGILSNVAVPTATVIVSIVPSSLIFWEMDLISPMQIMVLTLILTRMVLKNVYHGLLQTQTTLGSQWIGMVMAL